MNTCSKTGAGFTLIELMIVVAIIGVLAAIAVPNFIAYRNKARIGSGLSTAASIRSAMGGYASISIGNVFPMSTEIPNWATLQKICSMHGANLSDMMQQGFSYFVYHGINKAGVLDGCNNAEIANECSDFCMIFRVSNAPQDLTGVQIELRPFGVLRQTYSN